MFDENGYSLNGSFSGRFRDCTPGAPFLVGTHDDHFMRSFWRKAQSISSFFIERLSSLIDFFRSRICENLKIYYIIFFLLRNMSDSDTCKKVSILAADNLKCCALYFDKALFVCWVWEWHEYMFGDFQFVFLGGVEEGRQRPITNLAATKQHDSNGSTRLFTFI